MMFRQVRRGAIALALALFAPPAMLAAQAGTGTVRGTVTDAANGRGLAEAQVTVSGTRVGTTSGTTGEYVLVGVPAGPRVISVRRIGYSPTVLPVSVTAGATATLEYRAVAEDDAGDPKQATAAAQNTAGKPWCVLSQPPPTPAITPEMP